MMSRAITRPLAAFSATVSVSATGVIRSRMMRSTSSTGSSGPENAKQSSVSCAITRAPYAPGWRRSARHAGSGCRRWLQYRRDRRPERAPRQRLIGGNGDDGGVIVMEQRLADAGAIDFELGMRRALVALDQDEIDRAELLQAAPPAAARRPRATRAPAPTGWPSRPEPRWRRPCDGYGNPCPADRRRRHDGHA